MPRFSISLLKSCTTENYFTFYKQELEFFKEKVVSLSMIQQEECKQNCMKALKIVIDVWPLNSIESKY